MSSNLIVFVLTTVFTKNTNAAKAVPYYCEFGLCESEQYCCGDNKCCDKLLDLWYFWWLGLGIVIVVVAVIIFLKYFLKKRKSQNYRYKLLEQT